MGFINCQTVAGIDFIELRVILYDITYYYLGKRNAIMDNLEIIIKLQAFARRIRDRKRIVSILETKYEKIYDPNRKKYFYYDMVNDTSTWKKPKLLGDSDISKISLLYSEDEAAGMIQRQLRRMLALHIVRMLFKKRVSAIKDEGSGQTYYYNKVTEQTFWELPEFMGGKLKYHYKVSLPSLKKSQATGEVGSDGEEGDGQSDGGDSEYNSDEDEEDSSDESEVSESSEDIRLKRRLQRKYPRSRAQLLIDECEDREDKKSTLELNLSGIGAARFSSRIYDLQHLKRLILSNNKLTRLSPDIKYLINLEVLDIRKNMIRTIPLEIEEIKGLKVLLLGNNKLGNLPGNIYRLAGMMTIDISYNRFEQIPVEVGNMELLKDLHEWEVGIGLYKKLSELNVSNCKLTEWPGQVNRIPALQMLNLSGNDIESVSVDIKDNSSLKYLDISRNKFIVLPVQFYSLTQLQTLILHHNGLDSFPNQSSGQFKLPYVTNIDLSYNRFQAIDNSFVVFPRLQILNISHNQLKVIEPAISILNALQTLDASYNMLELIPDKMGGCVSLSTLLLNNNKIQELPSALVHLMNLKTLDMRENRIVDPKPTFFNTLLRLQDMNLSHNQLMILPGSLFSLSKLQTLDLSHNRIEVMPALFYKLTSLVTLNLSYNRVGEIPQEVSNLQKLDCMELRDNLITSVPDTLTKMKSLRRIDLINNLLADYSEVLRSMTQLRGWNLSGNKIVGEYGNFLMNTDTSMMTKGVGDDRDTGNDAPVVKVEFLVRQSRKLWQQLENVITNHALGQSGLLNAFDLESVDPYDENSSVVTSYPWLIELQEWSSALDDSIQALPNIESMASNQRGATVAAAVRALLKDPEFKRLMQTFGEDTLDYRPYEHHIFTHEVLKILDMGHEYIEIISDFESLGRSLCAVSNAHRAIEFAHLQGGDTLMRGKGKEQDTDGASKMIIKRSATMATVEEVEEEMDRRIDELVSASRERTASSRGFTTGGGLDGVDVPEKSLERLSAGAMKMMKEFRPTLPSHAATGEGKTAECGNEVDEDEGGVSEGTLVNEQEGREESEVTPSLVLDSDCAGDGDATTGSNGRGIVMESPLKPEYISKYSDDQSLKDVIVGAISNASEKGSLYPHNKSPLATSIEMFTWKTTELLYDPAFGNPKDSLLFKVAFECYYGLGLALVERGERLSVDIRRIERNCKLTSKLQVGQRFGDDMRDLLVGYEALFPKKTGSTGSTATLKMPSLFSLSEAVSVSAASLASDEILGEGDGVAEKHSVDMETKSVGSVSSQTMEDPGDIYLKSLYSKHAKALITSLMRERRKIYLWAALVLGCAADLLHLYGWDAASVYAVENEDNTVLIAGKDLRSAAVGMTLTYSKALLGAGLHAMALEESEKVLRWSPHFRTAEVIRIRSLCGMGDYPCAKERLTDVLMHMLQKNIREIKLRNVMKKDVELGYLMIFIDACDGSLSKTGYGTKDVQRKYDLQSNGVLERPLITFKDSEHGLCPYNDWVIAQRDDALQTMVMHKREKDDRNQYYDRKKIVSIASETAIAEFKELMDNLGPIVINMKGDV